WQHEKQHAEHVDQDLRALAHHLGKDIDTYMLVLHEGVTCSQQKNGAEKIPLDLQPCIGTHMKGFTNHRVTCADQHHQKGKPDDGAANVIDVSIYSSG